MGRFFVWEWPTAPIKKPASPERVSLEKKKLERNSRLISSSWLQYLSELHVNQKTFRNENQQNEKGQVPIEFIKEFTAHFVL